LEALVDIAKQYNLYTIEDCTHGFGGTYEGKTNGSFCDAAFFSTQWNKPFSTGIGGFAITRRADIAQKLHAMEHDLVQPSFKELANLKVLYFVRRYLLTQRTYWVLVKAYRFLSKHNLVVGSSSGEEITSTKMPDGYFKAFSNTQAKEGLRNLAKLPELLKLRKHNASLYRDLLERHDKTFVEDGLVKNHSFLKYPLLVKDRAKFMLLAEQNQIELGDWFTSPLHPIQGDLSAWNFDASRFPVASYLAEHVVNLPTTPSKIAHVVHFLEENMDDIL
jgi:dTDP-4-amino-4,6-dideoxygalactose transaminase